MLNRRHLLGFAAGVAGLGLTTGLAAAGLLAALAGFFEPARALALTGFLEDAGRRAISDLAVYSRRFVDPSPAFPQLAFVTSGPSSALWPVLCRP